MAGEPARELIAVDTSVAIALLVSAHPNHTGVRRWGSSEPRELALCGHAVAETFSVLTRLPGDLRVSAADAADLIAAWFPRRLVLSEQTARAVPERLARAGVLGGAVYDGLVALAAADHGAALATRDKRAAGTYERIAVQAVLVTG